MLIHAIRQGSEAGSSRRNRPDTARMPKALETRNRTDPNRSGRQTYRSCSLAPVLWTSAANVLMLKNRVPGNWVAAASQLRSCGSHAHSRTRAGTCWPTASTPVVAGLCDWTSWHRDADVKKIEPTK